MIACYEADNIAFSELHVYRGHQKSDSGFIMGHEFTGTVFEVGSDVHTVNVGDKVVVPFTVSWYVMSKCAIQKSCLPRSEECATPPLIFEPIAGAVFIVKRGSPLDAIEACCSALLGLMEGKLSM